MESILNEEIKSHLAWKALQVGQPSIQHRPDLVASLKEFAEEFPKSERDAYRKKYLLEEIERTRQTFFASCTQYSARTDEFTYWSDTYLILLERRLLKLNFEAKALQGKKQGITPEMIATARQYPIGNLIEVIHGYAICPFHADKHPSLDVRKNFYYCYSCNATGDVIDLVMKLRGLTFDEAIKQLN